MTPPKISQSYRVSPLRHIGPKRVRAREEINPQLHVTACNLQPSSETITIVVEPLKDAPQPAEVRLRQWLKLGLRGFRLRCVEMRPDPHEGCATNATPKKETEAAEVY